MRINYSNNGQEYFNRTCPYCKESVTLHRSNNNAVMFDKQIYHLDCFLKSKSIQKKCKNCKHTTYFKTLEDIEREQMVFYQGLYYCNECFADLCKDGINRRSKKWINANANFDKYLQTANDQLSELLAKKIKSYGSIDRLKEDAEKYAEFIFAEYDVNDFIRESYGVIDTSNIYVRHLKPLYTGTSKKYVDVQIPPQYLIEMWRTKISYLQKIYQRNIANGKEFTPTQRVLYDLAVLVGKYESFLEWKNKQIVLESNTSDNGKCEYKEKIDYTNIRPTKSSECVEDIDDILNDIFN